jgi:hypothetical protein
MAELFALGGLLVVGALVFAVLGTVFALIKLVLWLVFLPLRLAFKLLFLPFILLKWLLVGVVSVILFGGLYMGVRLLE